MIEALDPRVLLDATAAVYGAIFGQSHLFTPYSTQDTITLAKSAPDGGIIAIGVGQTPAGPRSILARIAPDLDLDTTFSTTGAVTATDASTTFSSFAIASDGSIDLAAESPAGISVQRFTATGRPDLTFNAGSPLIFQSYLTFSDSSSTSQSAKLL